MNRLENYQVSPLYRVPLASGDEPIFQSVLNVFLVSSPRKRGWTEELNQFIRQNSEFPAQAGMLRNEDFFNVFNVFNVEIPMIRSHILL